MDFDAFRGTPGNFRGTPGALRGGGTQADLRTPQGEDYRRGIGDNGRTSHTPADP